MSDREVSELDEVIEGLEDQFNYSDGFDQMLASGLLDIAKAIQSELHTLRADNEALEAKYEQLEKRIEALEPCPCSMCSGRRGCSCDKPGHHLEINRGGR